MARKYTPSGTLTAAMSLCLVSVYAPFTISAILSKIPGVMSSQLFAIAALCAMGLGAIVSGLLSRTGLLLAPAIGMSALIQQAISTRSIEYKQALLAALFAGFIGLVCSAVSVSGKSLRFWILTSIPEEVKAGIRGGVGALLATQAIENFSELTRCNEAYFNLGTQNLLLALWAGAFLALFCCDLKLRMHQRAGAKALSQTATLALVGATALTGIVMVISGWLIGDWRYTDAAPSSPLTALTVLPANFSAVLSAGVSAQMIPLTLLFVFIFFTDIPGTPYEKLVLDVRSKPQDEPAEVRGSFFADSLMAMVNPLLGIPPSIYYSENAVLDKNLENQGHNPKVAFICAAAFLLLAALLCVAPFGVKQFHAVSIFAVSPILLFLGVRIVADSIGEDVAPGAANAAEKLLGYFRFMPAAVAIVLTGVSAIGFAMAIPISITVCAIYKLGTQSLFASEHKAEKEARTRALLATVAFAACSVAIILSWLIFTRLNKPHDETQETVCSTQSHTEIAPKYHAPALSRYSL